ncbi:CRAL/TRIO domain, partial [Popillia japonica]
DNCLKQFLLWSKLDFDKAKKKFQRFCYNTTTHGEYFNDRNLATDYDLKCMEYSYIFPLPKSTPQGYKITITIHTITDPDRLSITELIRYFALMFDYIIHKDSISTGSVLIFDLQYFKPHHYGKLFNLQFLKFLRFSEQNLPFMVKQVLVLNCHPLLEKGVNLCKSVVSEKISNRMVVSSNLQDLHKHIPLECMPMEYGGTSKRLDEFREDWRRLLMEEEKFLVELPKIKPTGPVPQEVKDVSSEFGLDGSFRKLNID